MNLFQEFKNKMAAFMKENFSALPQIATPTVELKTIEGNVVGVDKLEPGGTITIDGATPADGSYTLETGEVVTVMGGVIGEVSTKEEGNKDNEPPATAPAPMTTPQQMKDALQQFADNPANTPDMAKLVTIVKACFEYSFGYQIREEAERAQRQAAIDAYKTGFTAHDDKVKLLEGKLKELATIVSDFAEMPIEQPKVIDWENMTPLQRRRATK
jgi:hypothetical protein